MKNTKIERLRPVAHALLRSFKRQVIGQKLQFPSRISVSAQSLSALARGEAHRW